jgi:hypothetical protein
VDDVIAEVATPNGIDRKDLKNFRNRLNRGRAHWRDENAYQIGAAEACALVLTALTLKEF